MVLDPVHNALPDRDFRVADADLTRSLCNLTSAIHRQARADSDRETRREDPLSLFTALHLERTVADVLFDPPVQRVIR